MNTEQQKKTLGVSWATFGQLTRCVAWGKFICISEPHFPYLNKKTNFGQHLHISCKNEMR